MENDDRIHVNISLGLYDLIGINQLMCSKNCPCKDIPNKNEWTDLSAEELKETYRRELPFVFSKSEPAFSSYSECLKSRALLSSWEVGRYTEKQELNPTYRFWYFAKAFSEQIDFPQVEHWIEFFESSYNCAGICKPALFSYNANIEAGIPK